MIQLFVVTVAILMPLVIMPGVCFLLCEAFPRSDENRSERR